MTRRLRIPDRPFVWSTETWRQEHAQQSGRVRSYDAEPMPVARIVRRGWLAWLRDLW